VEGRAVQADPKVAQFRQIVLWPLELMPLRADEQIQKHWNLLERATPATAWREVEDEFTPDAELFQERHYSEFVTFLPYVQRFLYGENRDRGGAPGESPIRVFRRTDVARARLTFPGQDDPIVLDVVHVDLYFFYDIDVVILVVELSGTALPLPLVQETLYRLGRAYPTHWDSRGQGGHCLSRMEWLSPDGAVLAASDYEKREKFLSHVCRHRAPAIASHWEFLLTPMSLHQSDQAGILRYRPIEYHRMPLLGYLAMAEGAPLGRAEFARLGLVTPAGPPGVLPFSESHLVDFEARYCYDRYWDERSGGTRYLCSGEALMMVGRAADPYVTDRETGLLAHFRHQHFLLFLIAHFHRASLVMLSDRLVDALSRLDIGDAESVKQFKRSIRHLKEIFLRFTHRYWFHEISDQAQARALYRMARAALDTERLFAEVRDEIQDMSAYLDSDSLRRQANTVIRLTVVTTVGLIGTITTGFLGMNLLAAADASGLVKVAYFVAVLVPTTAITAYSILRSKRLADFLEALADERLPGRQKLRALAAVWHRPRPRRPPPHGDSSS
jgi:CorA-like Mg2+ transporter protein